MHINPLKKDKKPDWICRDCHIHYAKGLFEKSSSKSVQVVNWRAETTL